MTQSHDAALIVDGRHFELVGKIVGCDGPRMVASYVETLRK
jgi:hypothetical protein